MLVVENEKINILAQLVLILSSVINDNEEQRDILEILERRRNMPKTVHKIYLNLTKNGWISGILAKIRDARDGN